MKFGNWWLGGSIWHRDLLGMPNAYIANDEEFNGSYYVSVVYPGHIILCDNLSYLQSLFPQTRFNNILQAKQTVDYVLLKLEKLNAFI